jgi:N-acetylmuramoyl-L-alanine amidase
MKREKLRFAGIFAIGILICIPTCTFAETSNPDTHQSITVCFFTNDGNLTGVQRLIPSSTPLLEVTLEELTAGPLPEEIASGLHSAIPDGTFIQYFVVEGDSVTVDFSTELLAVEMTEFMLESIFRQISCTLGQFDLNADIKLTVGGIPLTEFLPPLVQMPVILKEQQLDVRSMTTGNLSGFSLTLSPGHGLTWTGSSWSTMRPVYCYPLNEEDFHNLEMCQYLEYYLLADGMTVNMVRCTDMNYGNHSSGNPWWQMAAYLWLEHLGYPCTVYADYTDDCETGSGGHEGNDDIRARPLASDYDNTDIYISLHTNGYLGDCYLPDYCPTGTETYYDNSPEHRQWGDESEELAIDINSSIMDAIVNDVDSTWTCHGTCVKNSNGAYGEIRIPDRPAVLIELGFHDTCDRDADGAHLRSTFFRSASMWGIYKGICDYFGTTPTWDFYSDEYLSDTIPDTMHVNESYQVSITFRNRGVLWNSPRGFSLGAVGGSDPFTTATNIKFTPGEIVHPGQTYTFTFTMTAPDSSGTYTTDWQMVRSNSIWFGDICQKDIMVNPIAPVITQQPEAQTVCPGDTAVFTIVASGEGPLSYRWQKDTLDLIEDDHYTNVNTQTLTIVDVNDLDLGQYRCLVSNAGGEVPSDPVELSFWFTADFDDDCDVDLSDFALFANYWLDTECTTGEDCDRTNLDSLGLVDLADLQLFVEQWLSSVY